MEKYLRSLLPAFATALIATTSLFADTNCEECIAGDSNTQSKQNKKYKKNEKQVECCCPAPSTGRPQVKEGSGVFITGDVLLWNAHENGLTFVAKSEDSSTLSHATEYDPNFQWDWGWRAGIGYDYGHDQWDNYLNWTHIRNTAKRTISSKEDTLFPRFSALNMAAHYAKAHWKVDLDMVDLELGRQYVATKWLSIRPHMGLRSAWIFQEYNIDYSSLLAGMGINDEVKMKNKFWGLGIRGGLDTQWGFGGGWSIYGDMAFSLLYGYFDVKQKEFTELNGDFLMSPINVKHHFRLTRAITDFALGLRWDKVFHNDKFHFGIQAGWEHHLFFGQNQLSRYQMTTLQEEKNEDLGFQGWTLSARFDF